MSDPKSAADRLWAGLEALAQGLPASGDRIPTVRVVLDGGGELEIFRADRVPAAAVAWRVRGFTDDGVRLAAILGTHDGRAMVTTAVDGTTPAARGLVVDATIADRDIADLSAAIADAIRALVGPNP